MKESVLSLKENQQYNIGFPTFKLQVHEIVYDCPFTRI